MTAALNAAEGLLRLAPAGPRPGALPDAIELTRDWAALEPEWRQLEADAEASPYQRFDWMDAFRRGCPSEAGDAVALVLRDGCGRIALIQPLSVRRGRYVTVVAGLGGRHANFQMPLVRPGAMPLLEAGGYPRILRRAAPLLGADLFAFANVPLLWRGHSTVLGTEGRPSPSDAYRLTLEPDADATLARALSKDARKKLRQKEKHLAALGPVSHAVARDPADVSALLAAFLEQKSARFRELGIPDPFAGEGIRRFLRESALSGLDRGRPAVELHGLAAGERIVAVFGAAVDPRRCSGMFISFDGDPAVARSSPGDLLLARVVRFQCGAGREVFDLGVGEARYKSAFCPEPEPMTQVVLPVTLKGRVFARSLDIAAEVKRGVKRNPTAFRLLNRARALAARAT